MDKSIDKKIRSALIWPGLLFLALVFELSLFNIQHWRSAGNTEVEVPLGVPVYQGMLGHTADGSVVLGEDNYLQFSTSGIQDAVQTIALNAYCADGDETWWGYMRTQYAEISSTMVSADLVLSAGEENILLKDRLLGAEQGQWDVIALPAGKPAQMITLKLSGVKGRQIVISGIRLNSVYPFAFKPMRVLAVFMFMLFLYIFRPQGGLWKRRLLNEEGELDKSCLTAVVAVFIVLLIAIPYLISQNKVYMQSEGDFHPYTDLARALAAGSTSLLEKPSDELLSLDKPYDPISREDITAPFRLDYAYYNGKYYIYFGIVPCLFLYLPYYLITGSDLPGIAALSIMLTACYLGMWLLVKALIKRYAPAASAALAALIWLGGSAVLSLPAAMGDACNYYTPMLSAVDLFLFGMYLSLAASDEIGKAPDGKKGKLMLAGGSLCLACVAGCRPQLVLGAACTLPVLIPILIPKKDGKHKPAIGLLTCFALPYVIVAAGLMIYNAVRFGSPFDFGAMYNLTLAFLTNVGFHWESVGAGLYYYLLRPLTLMGKYPYLDRSSLQWSNPSLLASHPSVGGMFVLYPLMLTGAVCLAIPKWKGKDRELAIVGSISFVLVPMIAAVTAVMGGLMDRYRMDISVFAAFAFMCAVLLVSNGMRGKRYLNSLRWGFIAAVLLAVIISGLSYGTEGLNSLYIVNPEKYADIAKAIEFWR